MKKDKEKWEEEFRQIAYPIVHSNTFPEKDMEYLEMLINYFHQTLLTQKAELIEEVKKILVDEILICRQEQQSTSRLTAIYNKVVALNKTNK